MPSDALWTMTDDMVVAGPSNRRLSPEDTCL